MTTKLISSSYLFFLNNILLVRRGGRDTHLYKINQVILVYEITACS